MVVEHPEIIQAKKTVLLDAPPYWHGSGDVILQVTNNGIQYRFCVHQHVISLHSSVWKDMFNLGKESEQRSVQDELPIVPLEDPLKDVCSLIWAFYYGLDDFYESTVLKETLGLSTFGEDVDVRETTDLEITLGLSHKYQADKIHKVVVKLLLESWSLNHHEYFEKDQSERERIASSIEVIRAARMTNCAVLLPTAFYELATIPMERWTVDGVNKLCLLPSEDLSCLFLGKSRICLRFKIFLERLLEEYRVGHDYGDARCCNRRQILLRLQAELGSRFLDGTPSFEKPFALGSLADLGVKNCITCGGWIFGLLRDLEEEIWKDLPVEFNLPAVDIEYRMPRKRLDVGAAVMPSRAKNENRPMFHSTKRQTVLSQTMGLMTDLGLGTSKMDGRHSACNRIHLGSYPEYGMRSQTGRARPVQVKIIEIE